MKLDAGGRQQHRLVSGGTQLRLPAVRAAFRPRRARQSVDAIEIWWPSGARQRIDGPIAANNTIRITEGDDRWAPVYSKKR